MLSFYVNYRASLFVFVFFLNKELLKFESQMSFLLDETTQQKGVSQFLICKTTVGPPNIPLRYRNIVRL